MKCYKARRRIGLPLLLYLSLGRGMLGNLWGGGWEAMQLVIGGGGQQISQEERTIDF